MCWPNVVRRLLKLTPRKGVEFVGRFAQPSDNDLFEIALMALGESRLPTALDLLKERFANELLGNKKIPYLLPIAMTRLPQAIDFLCGVIGSESICRWRRRRSRRCGFTMQIKMFAIAYQQLKCRTRRTAITK